MDIRLQENLNNKQSNYIAPFLWLHGEEDSLIVSEIDHIRQSGINTITLESRTHEDFARDEWWSDVKLIFEECKKRNMNVWILDDKHYPTGYANGIFEEKYKDLKMWGITETHIDVAGPVTDGAAISDGWVADEDEILAVVALKHIPTSDGYYNEILDISHGLENGMVYFNLPEGMWRIVFLIKTQKGISAHTASYCDMLNPEAVQMFIEEVYQPHYDRFKEYFGNTFLGFFSDEPSFRNGTDVAFSTQTGTPFSHHPWGKSVFSRLKVLYGNRLFCHLAGLWFDIEGVSDKIRYDFMDIVTDEYRNNFCNRLGAWCREHGVEYIGHIIEDNGIHAETGSGAGHFFRSMDGQDMSGIDVVLHQIVPGLTECSNRSFAHYEHIDNDFFHYGLGKLGASLSHIDPKKKGRAMCEIFGAYGWAEGTKIMKYLIDHMIVRGVNYFVPHAFSPLPDDEECPPTFYYTGKNPEYKHFKYLMNYMNRLSYMLSDGKHVSTCAVLYDAESRWVGNDFLPFEKVSKVLYDNLLDYDIIPVDYLDKIDFSSSLNGEKYNVIFVPYAKVYTDKVIEKLRNCQAKIVVVTANDMQSALLYEHINLQNLCNYMYRNGFHDIKAMYSGSFLRYYHYTRENAHIYMFSNEDITNPVTANIELSEFSGGKYIEYDVFENKAVVKESISNTIALMLMPYNSKLILTGDISFENVSDEEITVGKGADEQRLIYKISLAKENNEEFEEYITTDNLFNITGTKAKPDFSGHIKYETEFQANNTDLIIDLGQVGEVAEMYINDKFVGAKLFPPYSFDISDYTNKGSNKMTVIVTNHNGYSKRDMFSKYLLLEPSGMLGPVKIKYKLKY